MPTGAPTGILFASRGHSGSWRFMGLQMYGTVDHSHSTFGTLQIGDLIQRYPQPRYRTVCTQCNTHGTIGQDALRKGTARCLSAGCGRPKEQTAREFMRAERERETATQSEREAREREAVATAEAQLTENTRKLHEELRKQVTRGRDSELTRDAVADGLALTAAEAERYNSEEVRIFRIQHPEANLSDGNVEQLAGYFERNGISLVSATALAAAYARLDSFGLLENRPITLTPQPVASPAPESQPQPVEVPAQPSVAVIQGRDLQTGRPREWTEWELHELSADDFRRAMSIPRGSR